MSTRLVALASGVVFGAGLAISGLTHPAVVRAFLDVTGRWDPTLGLVMLIATAVNAVLVALAVRRGQPILAPRFHGPNTAGVDGRLVAGAAVFGVGWGLAGVCPGPALASLASGDASVVVLVVAMVLGIFSVDVSRKERIMITRWTVFLFGCVSYALFLASFLYAVGFVGGFGVPTTLDAAPTGGVATALVVDGLLLALFAVQHSVMARPWFKAIVTRVVPTAAERSLYVLASSIALLLLFWQWQPIGGSVWNLTDPAARTIAYGVFALGWATVLVTTFLINHFDLFGLRQVWLFLRGRAYTHLRFATPGPYRHVRHPLYVGWLLAFWATPTMTAAHFFFAATTTAYILIAIRFEERDLEDLHGAPYAEYRRRVPMLIPRMGGARPTTERGATTAAGSAPAPRPTPAAG